MKQISLESETAATRARYQRIATVSDLIEVIPERSYRPWRERLWSLVKGPKILEVGVGTGRNIPLYPPDAEVTAIDLTPEMLARAERRTQELGMDVELRIGDVQDLEFPNATFDTVVATYVFCSVPDPVRGL